MGKPKAPPKQASNESRAVLRMVRISPQKLNLVAQSIRGMTAERAVNELTFSRKRIARDVLKCLRSAIANAENNHDLDIDSLVVAQAHVGKNLVLKRMSTRARGRGARIEKPFSQLTIVLRDTTRAAEAAPEAEAA
jgi:large subunit ribosomal protein L22